MRFAVSAVLAGVVSAALCCVALALAPSDVRLVAGAMPGYPLALPQVYPEHPLTAARRQALATRFSRLRIGGNAGNAVASMGHIHKIVGYGPGKGCDYFDGKFVVCVIGGRVVAKGFEIQA
jgi:hypothetical protein